MSWKSDEITRRSIRDRKRCEHHGMSYDEYDRAKHHGEVTRRTLRIKQDLERIDDNE